ncbi:MAG TPA: glycosyltransferase, partial [Clostridia bacterium]|nr:glycosyltransferase [Clostridia bacterium]
LMLSGIQLFSIGILGQYLAKTYLEVKRRPLYIIKDSNIIRREHNEEN